MKKIFIIMYLILLILVTGCTEAKVETKFFDFTVDEFVSSYAYKSLTHIPDLLHIVDYEEKQQKIAVYTFKTTNDTDDTMIHYHIAYDDETEKVCNISFNFDKSFMNDIENAKGRYRYHIAAMAEIINPETNVDEIYDAIRNVDGINEGIDGAAIYNDECFRLFAHIVGDDFSAAFYPSEN